MNAVVLAIAMLGIFDQEMMRSQSHEIVMKSYPVIGSSPVMPVPFIQGPSDRIKFQGNDPSLFDPKKQPEYTPENTPQYPMVLYAPQPVAELPWW